MTLTRKRNGSTFFATVGKHVNANSFRCYNFDNDPNDWRWYKNVEAISSADLTCTECEKLLNQNGRSMCAAGITRSVVRDARADTITIWKSSIKTLPLPARNNWARHHLWIECKNKSHKLYFDLSYKLDCARRRTVQFVLIHSSQF